MNITMPTRFRQGIYYVTIVLGGLAIVAKTFRPEWEAFLNQLVSYLSVVAGVTATSHLTDTPTIIGDEPEVEEVEETKDEDLEETTE